MSKLKIPNPVLEAFERHQTRLGRGFHRQGISHPEIYRSVLHIVERIRSEDKRTWLMIVGGGSIYSHMHKSMTEEFKVLELFNNAYGHIIAHGNILNLEGYLGTKFIFKPREYHGLQIGTGLAIVKIVMSGEFNPEDIRRH